MDQHRGKETYGAVSRDILGGFSLPKHSSKLYGQGVASCRQIHMVELMSIREAKHEILV